MSKCKKSENNKNKINIGTKRTEVSNVQDKKKNK